MKLFFRKKEDRVLATVQDIKAAVRARYGAFAAAGGVEESCCAAQPPAAEVCFAVDHGLYSAAQLAAVPATARNLSRGCGNPLAFAALDAGDTVVDFGCGGGIDVVLAARQVGPTGRVIGIDMTPEMITRAAESVTEAAVGDRVELKVCDMAATGLADASVDVVLSNCVINLSPDKQAVYAEALRILRPGGRLAISDVVLSEPIDPALAAVFAASWVGCMGGAIPETDYLQMVSAAGFTTPTVAARHTLGAGELAAMSCCPGQRYTTPPAPADLAAVAGTVLSIKFTATKPTGPAT